MLVFSAGKGVMVSYGLEQLVWQLAAQQVCCIISP